MVKVFESFTYNVVFRQRIQRKISQVIYPIYLLLSKILVTSRDFWIIELRSKNPSLSKLNKLRHYDYLTIQKLGTERKLGKISNGRELVYAGKPTDKVKLVARRLEQEFSGKVLKGVCHGVRSGTENNWLLSQLSIGSQVIGTDIHSEIDKIPNCIKWDFREANPLWDEALDFVYCNSIDQSDRPLDSLLSWLTSLKINSGILFLDIGRHTGRNGHTLLDPFCIEPELAPFFILKHFEDCSIRRINFPYPGEYRTAILEVSRGKTLKLINH